ncbi:MAG: DUF4129 domain-containing transglutaminase family protein [Candidatus Limnocylindria bacterium]
MTSATVGPATARTSPLARVPLAPAEGWLTVGLVLLLCLSLAWSLDDARLILGRDAATDMLPWVALLGVAAGTVGAKVGWGRWRSHAIGALLAALVVPVIAGTVLLPAGATPAELFRATADATYGAFVDLVLLDRLTTVEIGHHLWILGLLVWGTSMYAAYACFGHRRPLGAIVLLGMLLVGNIILTTRDQLAYLVLFSLAALFLLIRFHTLEEQADWLRRRIGDPRSIAGLYLRGGTIFIVSAVVGSLLLTQVASSDPLAGMWTNVNSRLIELARGIERFLPVPGSGVSLGPSFGSTAPIRGVWTTSDAMAMTVAVDAAEADTPYWAAVVYDVYALDRWDTSPARSIDREPGEQILDGTGDAVDPTARRTLTVTITPAAAVPIVFTPFAPSTVDIAVDLEAIGEAGFLSSLRRDASTEPYTITADLALMSDEVDGAVTANRLRVAGTDYPAEIVELYTALPVEAIGPEAEKVRTAIIAEAGSTNPYDLAAAAVRHLQDPANFTYDTDIRRFDCSGLGAVECFATYRYGYCEYYASTMAVLLRSLGIPTRLVEGYRRGTPDPATGVWQVRQSDAHAWVQVYFPRYGWVDFDPTGGGVAELAPIPPGRPEATPAPGASASARPIPTRPPIDDRTLEPGVAGGVTGTPGGSTGPLVAVALVLLLAVGIAAATAWRRGPRGPVTADRAYGNVTSLAARFGFGPRPDQTVYEYVGALSEALPGARPELETVARAKVETAYGGRVLGDDRLAQLREAQRRLRVSLLRLGLRRLRRRRGRR